MLIIDIETVPRTNLSEASFSFRRDNLPELKIPSNYKDPSKIAEKIKENKEKQAQMLKDLQERDALDPNYAEVIAIGIIKDNSIPVTTCNLSNEKGMLEKFFNFIEQESGPIVGYNVKRFDLRVLQFRCIDLGISYPAVFKHASKIDLMDVMAGNMWQSKDEYKSQLEHCLSLRMDVDIELAKSYKILEAYRNNNTEWIRNHLKQDLQMSKFLYDKLINVGLIDEYGTININK